MSTPLQYWCYYTPTTGPIIWKGFDTAAGRDGYMQTWLAWKEGNGPTNPLVDISSGDSLDQTPSP